MNSWNPYPLFKVFDRFSNAAISPMFYRALSTRDGSTGYCSCTDWEYCFLLTIGMFRALMTFRSPAIESYGFCYNFKFWSNVR